MKTDTALFLIAMLGAAVALFAIFIPLIQLIPPLK